MPLSNIDPNDIFWDKETSTPLLFVADDAFPLSQNIMNLTPETAVDAILAAVTFF